MDDILNILKTSGINLLYGILILVIGFFLIHYIMRFMEKKNPFRKMEPTLRGFLTNLIRIVLCILVILTAAGQIGIPLTSIITLVASAGVAFSLAMQGALSNLVGGFMLLVLKPIKAGEYVKVGDYEGTVSTIGAFYTELVTPDLRRISLPNSSLTDTAIVNNTREGMRRLDVTYSVSYDADIDQVYRVLNQLAEGCGFLVRSPAPEVHLNRCADSAVEFVLRVWMKAANYWDAYFYLTDQGKRALDQAGIHIPYPQMDVHLCPAPEKGADGAAEATR